MDDYRRHNLFRGEYGEINGRRIGIITDQSSYLLPGCPTPPPTSPPTSPRTSVPSSSPSSGPAASLSAGPSASLERFSWGSLASPPTSPQTYPPTKSLTIPSTNLSSSSPSSIPCKNRCKVTQTVDCQWYCDRCQGIYQNCICRSIFSVVVEDDTSSTWVSFFNEQAESLFAGVTAYDVYNKTYAGDGHDQDSYDISISLVRNFSSASASARSRMRWSMRNLGSRQACIRCTQSIT
jgi:hypothetical protein